MLNRYRDFVIVNQGGFANIFRALDTQTNCSVAFKVLRDPSPENRRRFRRERDMLLRHKDNPYVVNLLDSDVDAPQPYLVLEFAESGSLQYYVNNRRDWKRVAKWLSQIARGLEVIHSRGEWHRDIKPNNILLYKYPNGEEIVRLTDFGLAQKPSENPGSLTCSPYGTPGYIDPAAAVTGHYTWESDIYSLGVTIRELLTGNKNQSIFSIIPGPAEFRRLINSMTEIDRSKRPNARFIYQSIERLLHPAAPGEMQNADRPSLAVGVATLLGVAGYILSNRNKWDSNVKRYRNSKGEFQSGWLNL